MDIKPAISPKFRAVIWGSMLCSWLIQAVVPRGLPNPDGVAYLDISYCCLAGNWHALLNGYWSPGLPFMLTIWLKIFKPDAFHEGTVMDQMGLRDGDRVSYMGYALIDHEWAHLARLKIVAEIPEAGVSNFWASAQTERVKAIQWLASNGARVLVTRNVPKSAMSMGWTTVPDTDYCVLKLPEVNIHP